MREGAVAAVAVAVISGAVALGGGGFAVGFVTGRLTAEPARVGASAPDPASAARSSTDLLRPGALGLDAVPVTAQLTVHDDGCGVIRSGPEGEPHGLGWSVRDADGFEVLQRNALNETRYRYFESGTYSVVLVAWDGSSYGEISNVVTITC